MVSPPAEGDCIVREKTLRFFPACNETAILYFATTLIPAIFLMWLKDFIHLIILFHLGFMPELLEAIRESEAYKHNIISRK